MKKSFFLLSVSCLLILNVNIASAAIPFCKTSQNIVSSSLIGTWMADVELTARLADTSDSRLMIHELTFSENDEVAKWFGLLGKLDKCAYLAGYLTASVTKNGEEITHKSPFVLSDNRGNPTIFFDEHINDGDYIVNLQRSFVMVAKSKDRSKDILFVGGDNNNQSMGALIRK